MRRDEPLPSIFREASIVELTGHDLHETTTPERVVGGAFFRTKLSPMRRRFLRLRLDGITHVFEESRGNVHYIDDHAQDWRVRACSPRVISVRVVYAKRAPVLMLVDDLSGKIIGVIGESLAWSLDGVDLRLIDGRQEEARL